MSRTHRLGPWYIFIHLLIFLLTTATSATQIPPPQMDKQAQTMRHLGPGIFLFIYRFLLLTTATSATQNPATSDG